MDKKLIALLMAQHPDLAEATELALGFAAVVRQRQPDQLDSWLAQADHSTLSPFRRFAKRLREDYDAVKAGVTISVSNGPVEGHILIHKYPTANSNGVLWVGGDRTICFHELHIG